ncbi:MAG: hypothetical protein ACOCQS_01305 [Bacillota bacterium]
MFYFFEKIGRFIVRLAVFGLILVISIQFLMNNEEAYTRLREVEMLVKDYFSESSEVVEVSQEEIEETQGSITFKVLQNQSFSQVWLLCNGERIDSFSEGEVTVNVNQGDFLTIDATNYEENLWFEITNTTTNIRNFENGQQFRTSGEMLNIGVVDVDSDSNTRL